MAHQFLEDGNRVAVLDIKSDQISKLQTIYKDTLFVAYADAADENSLKVAIQAAIKRFGVPNIAIHNACICTFKSEPDTDYEVYQQVMNINYFGALRLAKLVLPEMRKAGEGKIIFTSSGVGVTGFGNISPYASSKGPLKRLLNVWILRMKRLESHFILCIHLLLIQLPLKGFLSQGV